MFVPHRKLIAAVTALGLGLGGATQALGAPLNPPIKQIERADASRAADRGTASGGYPTPESVGVSSATLAAIASCESGGDPGAVSADGSYRGKYQFDYGTWESVGGSGDPAAAPEAEQDYRAALLYVRGGSSPWPICAS